MKMSLDDWLRNGWLVAHKPTRQDIHDLLGIAERDLRECRTEGLSPDWRLAIAYNAALQSAAAALAAAGYRSSRNGQHYRIFQSLVGPLARPEARQDRRLSHDHGRPAEAEQGSLARKIGELGKGRFFKRRDIFPPWRIKEAPDPYCEPRLFGSRFRFFQASAATCLVKKAHDSQDCGRDNDHPFCPCSRPPEYGQNYNGRSQQKPAETKLHDFSSSFIELKS